MPPDEKDKPLVWVLLCRRYLLPGSRMNVWGVFTSAELLLNIVNGMSDMTAVVKGSDIFVTDADSEWTYEVHVCKTDTKW